MPITTKEYNIQKMKKNRLSKLHMVPNAGRNQPKIAIDPDWKPAEIRTTETLPIPFNQPREAEMPRVPILPTTPPEQTTSIIDHQRKKVDLLRLPEFVQIDLLQQILEELRKLNKR